MTIKRALSLSLLSLSLAVSACSGSDSQGTATLITSTEGGELAIDHLDTKVTFPSGAVAEDMEIHLEAAPLADFAAQENALAKVLVFDPVMSLESPAELVLALPDVDPSSRVYIMQFSDGVWIRPEVSALELGSLGVTSVPLFSLNPTAIVVEAQAADTGSVDGSVLHIYTEEPLGGISFELWQGSEKLDTTVSGDNGGFSFAGVPVGAVQIKAAIDAAQNCYNDPTEKEVSVTKDNASSVFFGFVPGPC